MIKGIRQSLAVSEPEVIVPHAFVNVDRYWSDNELRFWKFTYPNDLYESGLRGATLDLMVRHGMSQSGDGSRL